VNSSSLTPEEVRAAAEVHDELGPNYRDAVIESFLEKVGREIDARVDERVGRSAPQPQRQPQPPQQQWPQTQYPPQAGFGAPQPYTAQPPAQAHQHRFAGSSFALAIASLVFGIPITAIVLANGAGLGGLAIAWLGIAIVNVLFTVRHANDAGRDWR
jgi:hypothetical protein